MHTLSLQRFEADGGLRRSRVKKIERIQNLQLYTDYDRGETMHKNYSEPSQDPAPDKGQPQCEVPLPWCVPLLVLGHEHAAHVRTCVCVCV
eukprot:1154265-Pelagomonas_calceolata.AAC.4